MADSDDAARERFDELFAAHVDAVRAYVLRRVARQEADDMVSETFLVAWRRVGDVPEDALPWLIGVARRVVGEERRAAGRRDRLDARVATEAAVAGTDSGTSDDDGEVLAALAALTESDRELVLLICWEGLSSADAARVVGCTPLAARLRLHRARRRLAELLSLPPSPRTPVPIEEPERN